MDYEKKYKEALEWARKVIQGKVGFVLDEVLEKFPELKESEDERIRKAIHIYLDWLDGRNKDYHPKGVYTIKDMIAWLEKQGEHANFRNKIQIGDKVTRNEDGVLVNLSQLNRVAKKQGEQKPAKFDDTNAKLMFIKALERVEEQNAKGYKLTDCDKNSWWEDFKAYCSEQILANSAKTCKDEQKPEWSSEQSKTLQTDNVPYESSTDAHLWTRAIGFNGEPMESKPCEQNPDWSEEDELYIRELESLVKREWATAEHKNYKETIHKMSNLSFFLKTLKPQLKQEWSEDDENRINSLIAYFEDKESFTAEDDVVYANWLKSLKDRYAWKPSDEQMEALRYVTNFDYGGHKATLVSIYEQLKKLK